MTLKPIDNTFELPEINSSNDFFKYIAGFNEANFYETDNNGVVPNEIPYDYFFVNKTDLVSPQPLTKEIKIDGFLFVGIPSEVGIDIDQFTGQFENIIESLISKDFYLQLHKYANCLFRFDINNIRPLYNSVKYTKATNCTGVEINYSLWL